MTLLQQTIQAYLEDKHPEWKVEQYLDSFKIALLGRDYLKIYVVPEDQELHIFRRHPNSDTLECQPYTMRTIINQIETLIVQYGDQ